MQHHFAPAIAMPRPAPSDILHSFAPLLPPQPRLLILGSMPGVASLQARQYYAHPRNLFWRLLGDILQFDPTQPYPQRLTALAAAGVALWDVLRCCQRPGSSDQAIVMASAQANAVAELLTSQPGITGVLCNGATAKQLFERLIRPDLPRERLNLGVLQLPSTSPAHASMPYAAKLACWRAALESHLRPYPRPTPPAT